jgi:hypothetical protein
MGLFHKKADLIAEREKLLSEQLAAVEAQIKKLSQLQVTAPPASAPLAAKPETVPPPASKTQPRLRSTALPHGQNSAAPSAAAEPVFEEISQNQFKESAPGGSFEAEALGTRRTDLPALWDRIKNHFRGPSTSNPKLVSYLAAGSIQGLRPLRYEKRVARNRFIVLAAILALLLLGLFAVFFHK